MNRKEIELQINQAIDDRFLFGDRPLKHVVEHILLDSKGEIGQQDLLPSYVLSLLSSKLVLEAYPSIHLADLARGLLLFHIRFFDFVFSKKSVSAVFKAVQHADSGLVRRLYNQFDEYCRNTGLESIPEPHLAKWMMQQVGSVDERTAERHYKKGLERFYTQLIRVAPEFRKDVSASPITPPSETQSSVKASEFDLIHLLKRAMLDQCNFAPPIFGYQIPIAECLHLPIAYQAQLIDLKETPGVLKGKRGLITGAPGSGRSTLMRQIAYLDACCKDSGQAVYYLSARYVQDAQNMDDPLLAIARTVASGSSKKDVSVLRTEVQLLEREGLLIVLIDDLEHLPVQQQRQLVECACKLTSAYFSITPEKAASLSARIAEDGKPAVRLDLPELDASSRVAFARKVSTHMGIDQEEAVQFVALLGTEGMDLLKTPLGLCAALRSIVIPPHIQQLFITSECVSELLQRRDHKLKLGERLYELYGVSLTMYALGAAIYDFWREARSWDLLAFENRPFALIPVQKIQEVLWEQSGKMPQASSISEVCNLPVLEHNEDSTQLWARYKEFELLLAAFYLSFHANNSLDVGSSGLQQLGNLRTGWCGQAMSYASRDSERMRELQKYIFAV